MLQVNHQNLRYNNLPVRAISAPCLCKSPMPLTGRPIGSIWEQAAEISDFSIFRFAAPGNDPPMPSTAACQIRIFRSRERLYIGGLLDEPSGVCPGLAQDGWEGVSQCDHVELFFGTALPEPFLIQLGINAAAGRYSYGIDYDDWEAAAWHSENHWSFEMSLPLTALARCDYKIGFNIARNRQNIKEYSSWHRVIFSYFEIESLGELLFTDYTSAAFFATKKMPQKEINRAEYESFMNHSLVSADKLIYGPLLHHPADGRLAISFMTAGLCRCKIQFRRTGSPDWQVAYTSTDHHGANFHTAWLTGLTPNADYEYQICPAGQRWRKDGIFSTRRRGAGLRIALTADVHGDKKSLQQLLALQDVQNCDIFISLGDLISQHMTGLTDILQMMPEEFTASHPIIFVRGNHERRGIFAEDHRLLSDDLEMFRLGNICFLILDAGDDLLEDQWAISKDQAMIRAEREKLKELTESQAFQSASCRIALLHYPEYDLRHGSQMFARLFSGIFDQEKYHLDLVLCGHIHQYFRLNAGAHAYHFTGCHDLIAKQPPHQWPFTLCSLVGPCIKSNPALIEATILDIDDKAIAYKTLNLNNEIHDQCLIRLKRAEK